jgi:hypothetical protein
MRRSVLIVGALFSAGCATAQSQGTKEQAEAIVKAADSLAADMQARMSPDERSAFNERVEHNVVSEMQAAAGACGTKLQFTNEPKFVDRSVFADRAATTDQLACIRKSYPFVKASSK